MLTWAANEIELSKCPAGSEAPRRAHLEIVEKAQGFPHAELELSRQRPLELWYLWEVFLELYTGAAFSYLELKAYLDIHQTTLTPDEVGVLKKLTRLAL